MSVSPKSNNGSSVTSPSRPTASPAADNSHLQQQQHQQQQYQQQPMYGMPLSSQPVQTTTAAASSTAASAASTAVAAVPGSSSQPGQQSNFVPTGPYQYQGAYQPANLQQHVNAAVLSLNQMFPSPMSVDGSSYQRGQMPQGSDGSNNSFSFGPAGQGQQTQQGSQAPSLYQLQSADGTGSYIPASANPTKIKTTMPFNGQDFYTWSFEFELLVQTAGFWQLYDVSTVYDPDAEERIHNRFNNELNTPIPPEVYANLAHTIAGPNTWYLDSCCGQHMCLSETRFIVNQRRLENLVVVTVANNQRLTAHWMGSIVLDSVEEHFSLHLNEVFLVPRLGFNLISSAQLMKNGITLLGEPGKFTLKYGDKKLGTAVEQNGVFVLNFVPERTTADSDNILSLGPWEHRDDIDYTDDTVPREGVVPTSSTTAAAVMLTFDDQCLNDVENSRKYMAAVAGWGDTTNMPTNDGIWGADEPDETTWGETPSERAARLLAEAEQRVADMEILDSGRLVGVEPVPAAPDQESGELVLAPGEYVDVEVRVPPPNLTRYVAPAFDQIRTDGHQLLLSFFANTEYYLRAQGHKATGETWHKRLGHPSQSTLNNTIKAAVLDKNSLLLPSGLELKPVNRPAPHHLPCGKLNARAAQLGSLYWPFAMDHATLLHTLLSSSALPNNASPHLLWTGKLGLHLPSFSTNLVVGCALQDGGVHQFTPAYERVTHCTCARTGRHLATFTRQPGSDLYTLTTGSPQVAASASASASGQLSAPCSCRSLAHETVLWHHRLGHPVFPPLPPSPAPPCLPCVEGRQRAAPHSSSFPPTTAPLQTLHMDVWGPARVRGQGQERYFLIVVDDYSRYTTVFPLRTKGEVPDVLIPWIRRAHLQLSERFHSDFPVLRLHSDRGGEFSSDLLAAYCAEHGIEQSFTLPASSQQNGIAERRIGLVMEVARTSLIHAAAPHFLWPFAVRYAVHQLNLWPRVSLPETSPTLLWTGEVGDASRFRVWGSRAFVRDTSADKLSSRAAPCGAAPSGVSQVDPVEPVEVAVDSRPAVGAEPGGAEPGGEEPGGEEPGGAEPGGAESGGEEHGGAEPGNTEPGGAEPQSPESRGSESGGPEPEGPAPGEALSSEQLCEWYFQYCSLRRGTSGAKRTTGTGASASPPSRELPSRERIHSTGSAGAAAPAVGAVSGAVDPGVGATAGAADPSAGAAAGAEDPGVGAAAGAEDPGAGAAAGAVESGVGAAAGAEDPGAGVSTGSGVVARQRPYFVPLLRQVLSLPPSLGPPPPLECSQPVQSRLQLQPASTLPAPSPYTGRTGGLAERREPASRPVSPVRTARTSGCGSRQRPPPVPGTHRMSLRPSTAPLRAPLPSPPESSLPALPDPESDSLRAASPTVTRLLATVVTGPSFESTAASAQVAELVDFVARSRLDYATSLVAESESVCPSSVGGECALGTDVLEDRQEEFQCLAAASPHLVSVLLTPEEDPDALDIPTPRSYAGAIEAPYSSQWQAAMDAEMASWKSTVTYVDAVPPPGANIVSGMWIFRVKRPPGSPPVFKARYVARGFSQRQGVD
ncbi:unnamed protein product [Closterium sp. NIES-54]